MEPEESLGTLKIGEVHPASKSAFRYIQARAYRWVEPLASCAMEGNRMAEICSETLDRILRKEPVSDRYVLGLAWALMELEEEYEDV
jgi:hypothetical protein